MKGFSNASQISECINEIGTIRVHQSEENSDEFLINNKPVDSNIINHYNDLFHQFQVRLYTQLLRKCDIALLKKYIDDAKEVKKTVLNLNLKLKNNYFDYKRENRIVIAENSQQVRKILIKIERILNNIISIIEDERDNFDYRITADYEEILSFLTTPEIKPEYGTAGRATFTLSKKESIMLLYILEKTGLLKFESEEQISKFIENNFCFTEIRDNADKGKALLMKDVRSEISKLRARLNSDSNNKLLEKLLVKLNETIHLFEFKS